MIIIGLEIRFIDCAKITIFVITQIFSAMKDAKKIATVMVVKTKLMLKEVS